MVFDERFISEQDALQYCMERSLKAYARFDKSLKKSELNNLRTINYVHSMAPAIANSMYENMKIAQDSKLNGHIAADIARNIADEVIADKMTELLENKTPILIGFDAEGAPVGDSAYILNEVVEGMNSVCEGLGEEPSISVNPKKVVFAEIGNQSVSITEKGISYVQSEKTETTERVQ